MRLTNNLYSFSSFQGWKCYFPLSWFDLNASSFLDVSQHFPLISGLHTGRDQSKNHTNNSQRELCLSVMSVYKGANNLNKVEFFLQYCWKLTVTKSTDLCFLKWLKLTLSNMYTKKPSFQYFTSLFFWHQFLLMLNNACLRNTWWRWGVTTAFFMDYFLVSIS